VVDLLCLLEEGVAAGQVGWLEHQLKRWGMRPVSYMLVRRCGGCFEGEGIIRREGVFEGREIGGSGLVGTVGV
jgi:hypothetical protein